MTDQPQRSVRIRLARRRTAPARVRARVAEPQPEPEPEPDEEARVPWPSRVWRSLRGRSWAQIATVIGVASAIGGLFAQAVATYYDAAVSRDQLKQSRENDKAAERDQASQVTFWTEDPPYGPRTIHIVNRSPDAVSAVALAVTWNGSGKRYLAENVLAPCTVVTYSEEHLLAIPRLPPDGLKMQRLNTVRYDVDSLSFVDSRGRSWVRSLTGLSPGPSPLTEKSWKAAQGSGADPFQDTLVKDKEPQTEKAAPCGDGSQ
ncbi:hypothetical protein ACFC09_34650 [Streptomyces sp. NPDC056161]|uniref:hypothetical protein n=1 Tax=Streptomyces sp. NPDC056161 TaxID=3345732 RepID=UPI0035DC1DBE